jgi:hypothetical protein
MGSANELIPPDFGLLVTPFGSLPEIDRDGDWALIIGKARMGGRSADIRYVVEATRQDIDPLDWFDHDTTY